VAEPAVDPAQGTPGGGARLVLAAALLAIVIGATLLSYWVATKNFAVADPEKTPRTAEVLAASGIEGSESRRMLARYFASESNRAMFAFLGPLQLIGCAGALLLARRATIGRRLGGAARALLLACFVLSIALAPIVPTMISKGRAIDFVSRAGGDPPEVVSFKLWHGLYMAGDGLLLLGTIAGVVLLALAARAPSR
jgi:hypothetical protein